MIHISDSERRRDFTLWLRTGRLPSLHDADGVEVKFNPWHDPRNGRFTFAGAGRNYADSGGSSASSGGSGRGETRRQMSASQSTPQENHESLRAAPMPKLPRTVPASQTSTQSAAGPNSAQQKRRIGRRFAGAGGDFGGGGSSGDFSGDPPKQRPVPKPPEGPAGQQASISTGQTDQHTVAPTAATPIRREIRNGYEYLIDDKGRTRKVSGTLALAVTQVRSRAAQRQTGGADRRSTDDGGHYVAARFNGPTDAFNHFAQDTNLNRGEYRLIEDQ